MTAVPGIIVVLGNVREPDEFKFCHKGQRAHVNPKNKKKSRYVAGKARQANIETRHKQEHKQGQQQGKESTNGLKTKSVPRACTGRMPSQLAVYQKTAAGCLEHGMRGLSSGPSQ